MAQLVKNPPAMWETWVRSLGWEDPLEKEMVTHSSTLACKIPWMEEPGRLQSMGLQRVGHDCYKGFPSGSDGKESAYNVGDPGSIPGLERPPWRREWQPTPVFCLGNPWTEEPGGLQSMGSQRVRHA